MNTSQSVNKSLHCFFVLFVCVYAAPVLASEKDPTLLVSTVVAPSDSSTVSKDALPSLASSSSFPNTSTQVPDGFILRKIQKGETLSKLCNADSSCMVIVMKVNRIDNRHVSVGKKVLVPVDIQKAKSYVPVPKTLADSRGDREIRIFLKLQYFGAYENAELLFWGPVSSGKKERRTPTGRFFVNYKERTKRSLKYDNAPMPFSINYHDGYFIHQQSLPGYPASHGCVRLLADDAEKLFFWSHFHDPVTLVQEP